MQFTSQVLGHQVRIILCRLDKDNRQELVLNELTHKMILDINVLGALGHSHIVPNKNSSNIVDTYDNWQLHKDAHAAATKLGTQI